MDHKKALGVRSSIRFLIGYIMMYLHFISKNDTILIWFGREFSVSAISTLLLWFSAGLLLINNWLDIANEETHYRVRDLERELEKVKRGGKP